MCDYCNHYIQFSPQEREIRLQGDFYPESERALAQRRDTCKRFDQQVLTALAQLD